MSKKYPGGVLSKTVPVPAGPYEDGVASGMWTMEDVTRFKQQGVWPIAGNVASYIEDVFSTYLYTGTGSSRTITNNIDLSGKGGLVWIKDRLSGSGPYHALFDTTRGAGNVISSNATDATNAYGSASSLLTSFGASGFSLGTDSYQWVNNNTNSYVSWTFRKQSKFFDVVSYTGNGVAGREIAHNLGSAPGCIIVKCTSNVEDWKVYHRSLGSGTGNGVMRLNTTAADQGTGYGLYNWGNNSSYIAPTSTVFTVATDGSLNANGRTYVAYLFAHDAGGFGATGTDNVISCGSYTGNGTVANATTEQPGPEINLGWEPQWLMIKSSSSTATGWFIVDNMRDFSQLTSRVVAANVESAESVLGPTYKYLRPTSTGFKITAGTGAYLNENGVNYIYMAIRRGPMKVPTLGTSVYNAIARTGNSTATSITGVGFAPDWVITKYRAGAGYDKYAWDRLRGPLIALKTTATSAESSGADTLLSFGMDGINVGADSLQWINYSGNAHINWFFKRAPGFFDIVCYTPSTTADLIYHNLGVVPEMIIAKNRGATATQWYINHAAMGATNEIYFNTGAASPGDTWTKTSTYWNNSSALYPTGEAHVAYLFATLAGVSKVGSYTGTATTNQIDCGFTAGARFVLIKRTNSTGDWYLWDTVRGIISGNDPYLLLNSAAVEVTNTDYIDTYNAGFELSSTAPAALNASGGTYIFLAIA